MGDQEVDDIKRTLNQVQRAARLFMGLVVSMIATAILLPFVLEGFWLLIPFAYTYLIWEFTGWREERAFRKELKTLDRPGWDR